MVIVRRLHGHRHGQRLDRSPPETRARARMHVSVPLYKACTVHAALTHSGRVHAQTCSIDHVDQTHDPVGVLWPTAVAGPWTMN
eukprot:324463-Chlamydomonas_euryale.AAC.14